VSCIKLHKKKYRILKKIYYGIYFTDPITIAAPSEDPYASGLDLII
jgi:hypothetical protein